MHDQKQISQKKLIELYQSLYADLVSLASVAGVAEDALQKYFVPEGNTTSKSILFRLCSSLQNSGMMRNSIKFEDTDSPNYREAVETVMCGFNTKVAAKKYSNWKEIYEEIKDAGIEDHGLKDQKETNWQKYCRGLYDGLEFLDKKDGESKIKELVSASEPTDDKIHAIRDISNEIHGLGFALTSDWLKECGCDWLAKPDVHISNVIMHLKGVDKIKDGDVLREMFSWAKAVKDSDTDPGATAYKLDKIIWLLCTGEFYLDGKRIGRAAIYHRIDSL